jgi:hypothetical protein
MIRQRVHFEAAYAFPLALKLFVRRTQIALGGSMTSGVWLLCWPLRLRPMLPTT